jgi:large subunit ribosomal protein L17
MRHLNSGRKLSRNSSHRWALMRNMVTSLLREEKIQTTDPKAKELRRWVDRVITLGKEGSLHARRQALAIIQDKTVVHKLFDTIATRFQNRPGGYTRIIKIGRRHGDAAPLSLIELVAGAGEAAETTSGKDKTAKKKSGKTATRAASARRRNAKAASA